MPARLDHIRSASPGRSTAVARRRMPWGGRAGVARRRGRRREALRAEAGSGIAGRRHPAHRTATRATAPPSRPPQRPDLRARRRAGRAVRGRPRGGHARAAASGTLWWPARRALVAPRPSGAPLRAPSAPRPPACSAPAPLPAGGAAPLHARAPPPRPRRAPPRPGGRRRPTGRQRAVAATSRGSRAPSCAWPAAGDGESGSDVGRSTSTDSTIIVRVRTTLGRRRSASITRSRWRTSSTCTRSTASGSPDTVTRSPPPGSPPRSRARRRARCAPRSRPPRSPRCRARAGRRRSRRVAADHARRLEPVDAPLDRRRREADVAADVGERRRPSACRSARSLRVRGRLRRTKLPLERKHTCAETPQLIACRTAGAAPTRMFEEAQLYAPVTTGPDGVQVHLADDHPGAHDPEYRRRRNEIAAAALAWAPGEPIPRVAYTERRARHLAHGLPGARAQARAPRLPRLPRREGRAGLPEDRVPQLDEVTAGLRALTGFAYHPAAGLVPLDEFYGSLGRPRLSLHAVRPPPSAPLSRPSPTSSTR